MSEAYDPSYGRPTGDKHTISKQARKIDQMKQTIEHLHERLAAVQSSKRNKASQIARLKGILSDHRICDCCGRQTEPIPEMDADVEEVLCECRNTKHASHEG